MRCPIIFVYYTTQKDENVTVYNPPEDTNDNFATIYVYM